MKEIRIKNAIAMCHILPRYKEFIQEVKNTIDRSYDSLYNAHIGDTKLAQPDYFIINNLQNIAKGKGGKKCHYFYRNYWPEIKTIKKYTSFEIFVMEQLFGRIEKGDLEETIDPFYEYVYKNKAHLEQILLLLEKITTLGFQSIKLDETMDFTKEEYSILLEKPKNSDREMAYFENLERILAYGERRIKYKTNGSHYKIKFTYNFHAFNINSTIYVNSLLFSPSTLPCKPEPEGPYKEYIKQYISNFPSEPWEDEIKTIDLFEKIASLKEEKQEEVKRITKDVDDSLQLMKLRKSLEETKKTLNASNEVKDALLHMELELLQAEQICNEERKAWLETSEFVTEEMLKRELNLRKSNAENTDN